MFLELAFKDRYKSSIAFPLHPSLHFRHEQTFYDAPKTVLRWNNFLSAMGKDHIEFKEIIEEISVQIKPLIAMSGN
jgi:hypothetical protein